MMATLVASINFFVKRIRTLLIFPELVVYPEIDQGRQQFLRPGIWQQLPRVQVWVPLNLTMPPVPYYYQSLNYELKNLDLSPPST